MQTQCPYADCKKTWSTADVFTVINSQASNGFLRGLCINCQRPATLKPIEVIEQMERKASYLAEHSVISGGPDRPANEIQLTSLLEDIRSLHNVGSIFRTADALGFGYLYLSGITGTPPRKDVLKTSLGAEEHVGWQYRANSIQVLGELKQRGVQIVALERNNYSIDLNRLELDSSRRKPLCLVLGNEVSGVSEEALALCDHVCHIPMHGIKESLNVSVAFGIAAYHITQALSQQLM